MRLDEEASPAWVGRRQQHMTCRASTRLEFGSREEGDEAGITAYMNPAHHYEIAVGVRAGRRVVFVRRRIGSLSAVVAERPVGDGALTLSIGAEPRRYSFRLQEGDSPEVTLAEGEVRYLATEVAGGFTGIYLGLYAQGQGRPCAAPADFDWFDYKA